MPSGGALRTLIASCEQRGTVTVALENDPRAAVAQGPLIGWNGPFVTECLPNAGHWLKVSPVRATSEGCDVGNRLHAPRVSTGPGDVRGFAGGFTLVELMVTVAVAAVLVLVAVPSFNNMILSNRLATTANALVSAINVAQMNAIKLNATTQFCGSTQALNSGDTLGAACGTTGGAVYTRPQGAAGVTRLRVAPPGMVAPLQVGSAGIAAVRFSGLGVGYQPTANSDTPFNGTIAIVCTSQLASGNQRVISITAGNIVATTTATGACP